MRYGSKIAPQRPPSWKSIRRHISAVNDPIWVKCGTLTQNDMTITAMRSKIENEKDDGLKTINFSLVVQVISPGYSNV